MTATARNGREATLAFLDAHEAGRTPHLFGDLLTAPGLVTLFVDLTYANEGELAAGSPGGAAGWTWMADFRRRTRHWATPEFTAGLGELLGSDR